VAVLTGALVAGKLLVGKKVAGGAVLGGAALKGGAAAKGGVAAKAGGTALVGGSLLNGAGSVISAGANVASGGISAAASVAKFGLKAATVCVGLIGGAIKCGMWLNEKRKAKKKAKKEEKEKEELMRKGVVPNYAHQSHYGPPNPNAKQQGKPSPDSSSKSNNSPNAPAQTTKGNDGSPGLSTVFDKRSTEERRQAGGYVEGDKQIPESKPLTTETDKTKKTTTQETYDSLVKKPAEPVDKPQGKPAPSPEGKIVPAVSSPQTSYKGLSSTSNQSLNHDMDAVKAEVAADKQAQDDKTYQHHKQALVDKCDNDLRRIKGEYQTQKASYKKSQTGLRSYLPGSGKIAEAGMESLAKQFEARKKKLETDIAELDKKYGKA